MQQLVLFEAVGETAVPAAVAFARVVPRDDSTLFHRFLVLPGVTGVTDATGPWDTPGRTRTVHLSDGSRFREHLDVYDPPLVPDAVGRFDYTVTDYTKTLAHLVSDAQARWRFEPAGPAGERSRIRWTYGFRPLPGRRFAVAHLIGPVWRVYMRRSMAVCVAAAHGTDGYEPPTAPSGDGAPAPRGDGVHPTGGPRPAA
ncbi:SRPBCC family protein [Herbiconiux sp. VKM Ac-2851]|uniref:SRPBCC family protein n=1 Tax=Herbiconiux sp. VKM Ac-2851 TaxID=2739025 RepID=UPI0015670CAC|nr:SRPBCC family protein [Herbiconiux sp. VKM Ac-2851]NQX34064.1 SRPBCC family protein [Herbiconiux sp. VKM Ac-2851]